MSALSEGLRGEREREREEERRETNSLRQRPALANSDLITLFDTESRRDVGSEVLVTLFVTVVFRDVVEVFATDDERAVHLCGDDGAGEDTAADGDEAGEGAFLVYAGGSCLLV